ncbi:hypothetical protein RI054_10g51520 [Pseudoscourfieldia marina]
MATAVMDVNPVKGVSILGDDEREGGQLPHPPPADSSPDSSLLDSSEELELLQDNVEYVVPSALPTSTLAPIVDPYALALGMSGVQQNAASLKKKQTLMSDVLQWAPMCIVKLVKNQVANQPSAIGVVIHEIVRRREELEEEEQQQQQKQRNNPRAKRRRRATAPKDRTAKKKDAKKKKSKRKNKANGDDGDDAEAAFAATQQEARNAVNELLNSSSDDESDDDGGKDVNNTQRTTHLEHLTQEQRADLGDAGLLHDESGSDDDSDDDGGKDGNVNNTQRTTQLEHLTQEQRADLGDVGLLDSDSDSDHHGTDNEL